MKKLVSIFLVVLLLLTSLFVLTGCNKGGDGNGDSGEAKIDKSVQKYYDNAETGELKDKWNGLDLKFAYPKDKGYEIEFTNKKVEYQKATLKSKDLNSKITISFVKAVSNEIEKRKTGYEQKPDEYSNIQEIEFAGLKGITTDYKHWSGNQKIVFFMLSEIEGDENNSWYGVNILIEKLSTSSSATEFDPVQYYSEEEFQNLLNSLIFTKIDKVDVDGILGSDRYLIVKELEAPSEEYTVAQYPDTNGVMSAFMLKDGKYNGSGAYFRIYSASNIDKEKFGTLDKVMEYYSGSTWNYTYTDDTLAGQAVKIEHNPKASSTSDKYSIWESGYFEKDGEVFNFLYYRYTDVPEEIGTKLITEVLNGISFCNEE